jgi:hypothetical protein
MLNSYHLIILFQSNPPLPYSRKRMMQINGRIRTFCYFRCGGIRDAKWSSINRWRNLLLSGSWPSICDWVIFWMDRFQYVRIETRIWMVLVITADGKVEFINNWYFRWEEWQASTFVLYFTYSDFCPFHQRAIHSCFCGALGNRFPSSLIFINIIKHRTSQIPVPLPQLIPNTALFWQCLALIFINDHFLPLPFLKDSTSLQMRHVLSFEPVIMVSPS